MKEKEKKKVSFVYSLQNKEYNTYNIGTVSFDNYYVTATLNF